MICYGIRLFNAHPSEVLFEITSLYCSCVNRLLICSSCSANLQSIMAIYPSVVGWNKHFKSLNTRQHSSSMRIARLLTVSRGIPGSMSVGERELVPPGHTHLPPDIHTLSPGRDLVPEVPIPQLERAWNQIRKCRLQSTQCLCLYDYIIIQTDYKIKVKITFCARRCVLFTRFSLTSTRCPLMQERSV